MKKEKVASCGELKRPKFLDYEYTYIGDDEKWYIKDDAPQWAKDEFKKFMESIQTEENGMVIQR